MEIFNQKHFDANQEDKVFAEPCVNCGMQMVKWNTIYLCKLAIAEGIPGDFVECGVNAGAHPACMAYVSRKYDHGRRKVHLFDSFEGLPQAGLDDDAFDKQTLGVNPDPNKGIKANRLVAERWQVDLNMRKWDQGFNIADLLVFHTGWLQEVCPVDAPKMGPIAVLRVDVDLHDSTLPVFRHLYPLVPKGGYIISDDWGEAGATPARIAALKVLAELGEPEPDWTRTPDQKGTVWWKKK